MEISDILTPRDEVVEGDFQGVLQAHKVGDDPDRLENDAGRLLSMTYPSNAMQTAFDHVDHKLRGTDSQGAILLSGPYGAGKSHALLALYHLFNDPGKGQSWLDEWEIDLDLPDTTRATILSTSETDADRIWEPIFQNLGRSDLLDDINRYPTTEHIEELVDDESVAIFFDEIETWWESFADNREEVESAEGIADGTADAKTLIERNEFFLQNLLEVANDPDENLFAFFTLLDKSKDLKRILNRTNPYAVDLNDTGDRERIILHRLFETPRKDVDEATVREVVESYTEHYSSPIEIDELKRFENRMVETYPFHPELLDLLDDLYEGGKERQNVRGTMNVLADTVQRLHDETDLIITADIEPGAFRGINQTLFNRYNSDRKEVSDIDYGEMLLRTIFLYTIDDRSQEASLTECLLGTFKPSERTVSELEIALDKLYGTAHYLDRDSDTGPYYLTEDPKLTALITREQERALENNRDAVRDKLVEIVRDHIWNGTVSIYPDDEVADNNSITVVVTLDYLSNGSLKAELDDFFADRTYQNTVLFVTPKQELLESDEILSKAARVYGAENLQNKVDDEAGNLRSIIDSERRQLRNEVQNRYGKLVTWSERADERRLRRKNVTATVRDVKDTASSDKTHIGDAILDEVKRAENGRSVESLLTDFKTLRRLPVVVNNETYYQAIRRLHRDKKAIVLEGDRAKFYVPQHGQYPPEIADELTIHHPDNLDDSVLEPPESDDETETTSSDNRVTSTTTSTTSTRTSTSKGSTTRTRSTTGTDSPETVETETTNVSFEGNVAGVLKSKAKSRVNTDTDTVSHIDLSYDVDDLSKDELIEFLDQLPSGNKIDVELVIEREVDN